MININTGRNPELMGACKPLDEYTWLVERVRTLEQELPLDAAVDAALDDMPMEFQIRPFLEANRVEVKKMLLTEYNEAKTMEMFKAEGREEGREEGQQAKAKEIAINMYKLGVKPTEIAVMLNEALSNIQQWLDLENA